MKKYVNGDLVDMTPDEVAEFSNRPSPPPESLHIAWVRAALAEAGRLDEVDAAVASQGAVKKALWDFCTWVSRTDPDVLAVAAALDIDLIALYRRAAELMSARGGE